jgi:hypothetical protein
MKFAYRVEVSRVERTPKFEHFIEAFLHGRQLVGLVQR